MISRHKRWILFGAGLSAALLLGGSVGRAATHSQESNVIVLDTQDYLLTVVSAHGMADPPPGVITNALNAIQTCSVTNPVVTSGATQHHAVGWSLTGHLDTNGLSSGSATNLTIVLTNSTTLTWHWTNLYELTVSAGPGGSVNSGEIDGWYTNGVAATNITATPSNGYEFAGWTGDIVTNANPLDLTIGRPYTLTAGFEPTSGPRYWDAGGTDSNWSDAANWTFDAEPKANEDAYVGHTSYVAAAEAIIALPGEVCRDLFVGSHFGASGTVAVAGGELTVGRDLHVGIGSVTQGIGSAVSVGRDLLIGDVPGASRYRIDQATLVVTGALEVAGGGEFLSSMSEASFGLDGATSHVARAGFGRYQQGGGTNVFAGPLVVADQPGSIAEFALQGGHLVLQGGAIFGYRGIAAQCAQFGPAVVQAGDDVTLASQSGSSGGYELKGGLFQGTRLQVGAGGSAWFQQEAGTNYCQELLIGQDSGDGSYDLLAGDLMGMTNVVVGMNGAPGRLYVGAAGRMIAEGDVDLGWGAYGELLISNGTVSVFGDLTVTDTGALTLMGGQLRVGGDILGNPQDMALHDGVVTVGDDITFGGAPGADTACLVSNAMLVVTGTVTMAESAGATSRVESVDSHVTAYSIGSTSYVGEAGCGMFIQRGGTSVWHDVLVVGGSAGSRGTYHIQAGLLLANDLVLRTDDAFGTLAGYGEVAPTGTFVMNGMTSADGVGTDRALTITNYATLFQPIPNVRTDSNGWFALNRGELVLKDLDVASDGSYFWGESGDLDLVNAARVDLVGVTGSGRLRGRLLAADRPDVPDYVTNDGLAMAVWQFETNGFGCASTHVSFRYDHTITDFRALDESLLGIFGHDGTPGGRWHRLQPYGVGVDTDARTVTASNVPSFHYFAVGYAVHSSNYVLTASADPGGSIVPSGSVSVAYGAGTNFAITAVPGSYLIDVEVDGVSIGPTNAYAFTNITADRSIHATFVSLGTITVTSPNGGETNEHAWLTGLPYPITWNAPGDMPGTLAILFSIDGGGDWTSITSGVSPSAGSADWVVPSVQSDQVLVLISNELHGSVWDVSDETFELARKFEVVQPNGGEKWYLGQTNEIIWHSADSLGPARIDFSADGGWSSPVSIAPFAPSLDSSRSNSYPWAASPTNAQFLSETARVRVQNPIAQGTDHSDGLFTMAGLVVTSPTDGLVLRWSPTEIAWQSVGGGSNVSVEVQTQTGGVWTLLAPATSNVTGQTAYPWTPTNWPTVEARLRVTSLSDSNVVCISERFTIAGFMLIQPDGHPDPGQTEKWPAGSTQNVEWLSAGIGDHVNILYSTNSGVAWIPVDSNIPSDPFPYAIGEYPWTIPSTLTESARVRVESSDDPEDLFTFANLDFYITGLEVTSPTNGAVWIAGAPHSIQWNAVGAHPTLNIKYVRDGVETNPIAFRPTPDLTYEWTPPLAATGTNIRILLDDDRDFVALSEPFEIRGLTLTVSSVHGGADPSGTSAYEYGTNMVCSVTNSPSYGAGQSTQHLCMGWTGSGSVPPSGTGTNVSVTLTNDSSITWQWTNLYQLTVSAGANGAVNSGEVNGWYTNGTTAADITATPSNGYYFSHWSGDVSAPLVSNATISLSMDAAKSVAAHFDALGTLTVTSPNGGEVGPDAWLVGLDYPVTWTSAGDVPGTVAMLYSKNGGGTWITITNGVDASLGQITWQTPLAPSTRCLAMVSNEVHASVFDVSDGEFHLRRGYELVKPDGGERWYIGGTNTIYWHASHGVGDVTLDFSRNGAWGNPINMANFVPSAPLTRSNSYDWVIPTTNALLLSSNATTRVQNLIGTHSDVSDAPFTVAGAVITAPSAGEKVKQDSNCTIQWWSLGCGSNVSIEVQTQDGGPWTLVDGSVSNANGFNSYGWSATTEVTTKARLRLTSLSDPNAHGWSETFTIDLYAIGATAETHGAISPSGAVYVAHGGTTSFAITADEHYHVSEVDIDETSVGPTNTYTFLNVTNHRTINASFEIDKHALEIVSPFGAPALPVGFHTNAYGTALTNQVGLYDTRAYTQYVCTGWAMAGNEPATGGTTNMTMTHTNGAVLTWLWSTNFWLDTGTNGPGAVDRSDWWYARDSSVTVTATAATHYHFAYWSGDTGGCDIVANEIAVAMNRYRQIVANFAIDTQSFAVVTAHGSPDPATGIHYYDYGAGVSAALTNSPVYGGTLATQFVCAGWTGAGSVAPYGGATNTAFTITNISSITWQWDTNFYLDTSVSPSGSVDTADDWFAGGTNVSLTPVPSNGYHFLYWSGDVPPGSESNTPLSIAMDQPRSIAAYFEINVYDIAATAAANGTITPSGIVSVVHGSGTNFLIQAGVTYHVLDVVIDGESVGPTNDHVFTNVATSHTIHATFALDASFSLAVHSDHGTAVPDGITAYFDGTTVACAVVDSPVIYPSVSKHSCTGWVGTGSVPSSGAETNVSVTVTTNSAITWLWDTNFWLDTGTNGAGTVSVGDGWFEPDTNITVSATADAHCHFVSWSGDTNGCAITDSEIAVPMTQARAITANFDIDKHTLAISPPYGAPNPPAGTYTNDYGTSIICAVSNSPVTVVPFRKRHECTGWEGSGSVSPYGAATNTTFTLTNDSALAWTWTTNYWLDVESGPNGYVVQSDGWHRVGSNVTLQAVASNRYHFVQWTGIVPHDSRTNNPVALTIRHATSVTAHFAHASAVIYVAQDAPGDNDGSSWTDAYTNLQDALSAALPTDQVWVAKGTYLAGTDRSDTFQMREHVSLYGGFAGGETILTQRNWEANLTILSGDINGDDAAFINNAENTYRIVTGTNNAAISGFTVAGARGDGRHGGGMLNRHCAEMKVDRCRFVHNFASIGGGICNIGGSVRIERCDFVENSAADRGGAIADLSNSVAAVTGCRFAANHADAGSAIAVIASAPQVVNSVFAGNRALGAAVGGAIYAGAFAAPDIVNCTFARNRASRGGALHTDHASLARLASSILSGNAAAAGSGIFNDGSPIVQSSCDITDNSATVAGGTIVSNGVNLALDPFFPPDITGQWTHDAVMNPAARQATAVDSSASWIPNELAGKYVCLDTNSTFHYLVASNGADSVTVWGGDFASSNDTYCIRDYHTGSTVGRWEPGRRMWTNDTVTSPCVDAGHPSYSYEEEPLPNGRRINMGAYGNTAAASKSGLSVVGTPAPAVSALGAVAEGRITCEGGRLPHVYLYWGITDGGSIASNWQHKVFLGKLGVGSVAADLSDLLPATDYHYRLFASNKYQQVWSPETTTFTTAVPRLYVDGAGGSAAPDGLSWPTAFTNLADAFGEAVAGQQIWIAQGTYRPGAHRTDSFVLRDKMSLYGGLTNGMVSLDDRDPEAYSAVLSGDIGTEGSHTDNCYHVIIGARDIRLDGLTVRDGFADGAGLHGSGGGLLVLASETGGHSVRLSGCDFLGNASLQSGAGVCLRALGSNVVVSATVDNSRFAGNVAFLGSGGALDFDGDGPGEKVDALVTGCTFTTNRATHGGAIHVAAGTQPFVAGVSDSRFIGNQAVGGDGGAVRIHGDDIYAGGGGISNCLFVANQASHGGGACHFRRYGRPIVDSGFLGNSSGAKGGALLLSRHGDATVRDCTFAGNSAPDGSALYIHEESPSVIHCVIVGNEAAGNGTVYVSKEGGAHCRPRFINCTFSANVALDGGALYGNSAAGSPVRPEFINSILWADGGSEIAGAGSAPTGAFNCVEGGLAGTNIDSNPLFVTAVPGAWEGQAVYDAAGVSVLTDTDAPWAGQELAGKFVNADTNRGLQYLVISNDSDSVAVYGDLTLENLDGVVYEVLDYRLESTNSPCIDAGIYVGLPYLGLAPEMGAHEWGFIARIRVLLAGAHVTNCVMRGDLASASAIPLRSPYASDPRHVPAIPGGVTDWILLQQQNEAGRVTATRSAFVNTNGWVVDDQGDIGIQVGAAPGHYSLDIKHRNHLAVRSAGPVPFASQTVEYDFTVGSNKYFGGAAGAVEVQSNVWAMLSADADGDGVVRAADLDISVSQAGTNGYQRGDLDLDSQVTAGDSNLCWAAQGRSSSASNAFTVLAPGLRIIPFRKTVLSGSSFDFAAAGNTGTVHWTFVENLSGGTLTTQDTQTVRYVAGANTPCVDVIEAWDDGNRLGRASINVLGAGGAEGVGKAIVAAGTRGADDLVWPITDYLAGNAYDTLLYRGYARTNVYYVTRDLPAEATGVLNTYAGMADAFTNWAPSPDRLFVYFVDHGGTTDDTNGFFQINATQTLEAATLDSWLDAMQDRYTNEVVVVLDFCKSGSFVKELDYPSNRVVVSACSDEQATWFLAGGLASFSDAFFGGIVAGRNLQECYQIASNAMAVYQTPWLNDDGNKVADINDGALAADIVIGADTVAGSYVPEIGSVSGDQLLSETMAATLWADDIVSSYPVARVWAQILPPGYTPDPDDPVGDIVELELPYNDAESRYQATYNGFATPGSYIVVFYARDEWNSVSLPEYSTVQQSGFFERLVLVVGGETSDAPWTVLNTLGSNAYHTFRSRLFTDDDILYLNSATNQVIDHDGTNDVDGPPTFTNLAYAITNWAGAVNKLTVYLIGDSAGSSLGLNASEALSAGQLDSLLDDFQVSVREVCSVLEFPNSGAWVQSMLAPSERSRIVVASAASGQTSCRANDGMVSFSRFFLSGIFAGEDIGDAFGAAAVAILRATGELAQKAQIDDDASGDCDGEDGDLADLRHVGAAFVAGVDIPVIGDASPDTVLAGTNACTLWASGVVDADGVSNVWCVITPPEYYGTNDLPELELSWNAASNRHDGVYGALTNPGSYVVTFLAMDRTGEISAPVQSEILTPDAWEPDNTNTTAQGQQVGTVHRHNLHATDDEDWVVFAASTGLVYQIEVEPKGTNIDPRIEIYYRHWNGTLEHLDHLTADTEGGTVTNVMTWLDFLADSGLPSGMYCARVTSTDSNKWGVGSEYDLKLFLPAGGGTLFVAALDVLREGHHSPPDSFAVVDGVKTQWFGGQTHTLFTGLSGSDHTVEVVVPDGYYPIEDVAQPAQVASAESVTYGNPRGVEVPDEGGAACFLFYSMARIHGTVRDGKTRTKLADVLLRFEAVSGVVNGNRYTNYQGTAWAEHWDTDTDGSFPDDQSTEGILVPTATFNVTVSNETHNGLTVPNVISVTPAAGEEIYLDDIYLPVTDENGNGIDDGWEDDYYGSNIVWWSDTDGDGSDAKTEYLCGTDPTNAASVFGFGEPEFHGDGGFTLTWPVVPDRVYQVRATEDLTADPWPYTYGPWQTNAPGWMTWRDTNANAIVNKFYCVDVLAP